MRKNCIAHYHILKGNQKKENNKLRLEKMRPFYLFLT